jgi:hypothetical protein
MEAKVNTRQKNNDPGKKIKHFTRAEATKCSGRTEGSQQQQGPGAGANESQHVLEQTVIHNAPKFHTKTTKTKSLNRCG